MGKYKEKKKGEYKSLLEHTAATLLTEAGIPFSYETWSIVLSPQMDTKVVSYEKRGKIFKARNSKISKISYTPDFVGDNWVMETKGKRTEPFNIRWKLFKKYIKDNNLNLTLFLPTNKKEVIECIKIIKDDKTRSE